MMNVFIDPFIITVPSQDSTKEELEAWITNLNIWLNEALSTPQNWFHCVEVTSQVEATENFPTFKILRAWQQRFKLDINLVQIMNKVNEFFRNENFDLKGALESLLLVDADKNSIYILPKQLSKRWLNIIQEEMALLLTTACACKHAGESLADKLSIATATFEGMDQKYLEVSAIVLSSEPELVLEDTRRITQTFPLFFTPDDLLPFIDILSLWCQGESGIRYAIDQQYKKAWQNANSTPLEYRVPATFINSVKEAGLDTNEIVLQRFIKAGADIIADRAKDIASYELHPFRKNTAGASKQKIRLRDNARAWRLSLTKQGAGWRLHFWQIPDQTRGSIIEFSNIEKEQGPKLFFE